MDYEIAFRTLQMDWTRSRENIHMKDITKQYRKLALQYHPDKNGNTNDSNEQFKRLNEAYHFLKNEWTHMDEEIENDNNYRFTSSQSDYEEQTFSHSNLYFHVLKNFIKSVMDTDVDILTKIINDILNAGKHLSLHLFKDLDKTTALNIYIFLSKHKSILHFQDEMLDEVAKIVTSKYDNVEIYKLNPSINDILNQHFYKLQINERMYFVPLWHEKCYYDGSGCEIVVVCEPDLPNHITIDDNNNLIVETNVSIRPTSFYEMLNKETSLSVHLGDKVFEIPYSELMIRREQWYRIQQQGLVNVKKDIYDLSDKSDIIIKINFVDENI